MATCRRRRRKIREEQKRGERGGVEGKIREARRTRARVEAAADELLLDHLGVTFETKLRVALLLHDDHHLVDGAQHAAPLGMLLAEALALGIGILALGTVLFLRLRDDLPLDGRGGRDAVGRVKIGVSVLLVSVLLLHAGEQ